MGNVWTFDCNIFHPVSYQVAYLNLMYVFSISNLNLLYITKQNNITTNITKYFFQEKLICLQCFWKTGHILEELWYGERNPFSNYWDDPIFFCSRADLIVDFMLSIDTFSHTLSNSLDNHFSIAIIWIITSFRHEEISIHAWNFQGKIINSSNNLFFNCCVK